MLHFILSQIIAISWYLFGRELCLVAGSRVWQNGSMAESLATDDKSAGASDANGGELLIASTGAGKRTPD